MRGRPRGHRGRCSSCGELGHTIRTCGRVHAAAGGRPSCECHGVPMVKKGTNKHGEPLWYCSIKTQANHRRYMATHYRLKLNDVHYGIYPVTPAQRDRIDSFRAAQRTESLD